MVNFWEDPSFESSLGLDTLQPAEPAPPSPSPSPLDMQAVKQSPAAASILPAMWLEDDGGMRIWEAMREEIGDVPTHSNVLLKGFNGVMDITGSVINRVGDALTYPSDRLEQLIGSAWLTLEYGNEIPSLADRWKLAQLTWEFTGFGKGALREEAVRIAASGDSESLDRYIQEHEGGVSQMLGSFLADPLNLFGMAGLGYVAKGAKSLGMGKNVVTALELMNRGVRGDDLIQLGFKLPPGVREVSTYLGQGMKKVGLGDSYIDAVQKRQWDLAFGIMERGEYERYARGRRLRSHSFFRNLFERTPQSVANDVAANGMDELRFMIDGAPSHAEVQTYLAALTGGDFDTISKINPAFANDVRAREFFDAVSAEARATGFDVTALKSFNTDPTDPVQVVTNILGPAYGPEKIVTMTPEDLRAAWESKFFAEMQSLVLPAAQHWVGIGGEVVEQGSKMYFVPSAAKAADAAQSLQKLHAGYKKWLSVFYLNRPGFVALNVGNNTFTSMFDGFGFARGIPEEELAEWGLTKAGLAQSAKDVGVLSDVLGNSRDGGKWWKGLTPYIQVASKHDQMARRWVEFKQYRRTMQGVWQFRDETRAIWPGVLPQLPKNLADALGDEGSEVLKARILSTRGDPKKIRALAKEYQKGLIIADAEYYLTRAIEEEGFAGDNAIAMKDAVSDGFQYRFDQLLADGLSPQDAAQMLRAESMEYLLDYNDIPLEKLFDIDHQRPFNLRSRRHMQMMKIRRERDDLGSGVIRYMQFNGHEPFDVADMEGLLVRAYKADEAEWKKLYDVLDTPDVTRAQRDKAWKAWEKARADVREMLRTEGLSILGRNAGNPGAAAAWANVLRVDADTHAAMVSKLRETLDRVDALPAQHKVVDSEIRKVKGELRHMENRLAKIRRGGYAQEPAQAADEPMVRLYRAEPVGLDPTPMRTAEEQVRGNEHARQLWDAEYDKVLQKMTRLNPGKADEDIRRLALGETERIMGGGRDAMVAATSTSGAWWSHDIDLPEFMANVENAKAGLGEHAYYYVDVPQSVAERARLANQPEYIKDMGVTNKDREYILPAEWVQRRVQITDLDKEKAEYLARMSPKERELREELARLQALPAADKERLKIRSVWEQIAVEARKGRPAKAAQEAAPASGGLTAQDVLRRAAQRRGEKVDEAAQAATQAAPEAARAIPDEAETEAAVESLRTRLNELMEQANWNGTIDSQRDSIWNQYFKAQDDSWVAATDAQLGSLKLDRTVVRRPRSVPEPGLPDTATGALRAFDMREKILSRIANWNDIPAGVAVPSEVAATLRGYFRLAETYGNEARYVSMQAGRAAADFVYHNYNNLYGFDEIAKILFPYEFWPTRTMVKWAKRTMARPGATAAVAKLIDAQNEFDIPERLKGKFKIPIPGLPEWMNGGVYVDPIQVLFPFTREFAGNTFDNEDGPLWQQIADTMGRIGLSPSPFMTLPLALTGDGERSQFINFQMNGMPWFIPGTNAQRAISAFLMGAPDSEWKDTLQPEDIESLTLGQAFPEPRIREILGLKPGDEWDYYRTLRMLANMAGAGEISAEEALRAQKTRAGETWEKAKDMAAQENGLRALSSYVFGMSGTIYPKGEEIQRGLKMMLDLAREADRKRTDDANVQAFFAAYPEYQPRQVATAYYRGKEAVEEEVDTQLYYIDLERVHDAYDAKIAYYERYKNAGFKEFGEQLSALYAERSAALDLLEREYAHRAKEPSVYMPVFDRAMFRLREQYYGIDGGDYASTKAMRAAFMKKLTGPGKGRNYYLYQREADLILREYDQRIQSMTPGKERDALYTERKRRIEELTSAATTEINAADFAAYLSKGGKEPGDREVEDQRNRDALRTLLNTTREQWPQVFKDNPGLIERYGANPDPTTAGQLDSLWDGYYALPPKSQSREDYVYANQAVINALRLQLGLDPINVNITPKTGDDRGFQRFDPITEAIAAAERAAATP